MLPQCVQLRSELQGLRRSYKTKRVKYELMRSGRLPKTAPPGVIKTENWNEWER